MPNQWSKLRQCDRCGGGALRQADKCVHQDAVSLHGLISFTSCGSVLPDLYECGQVAEIGPNDVVRLGRDLSIVLVRGGRVGSLSYDLLNAAIDPRSVIGKAR